MIPWIVPLDTGFGAVVFTGFLVNQEPAGFAVAVGWEDGSPREMQVGDGECRSPAGRWAGACGSPRSGFHFSFPSRPKRRDLLWEGPSGGLVSVQCGHWSVVTLAEVGESRNTAVNRMRLRCSVHCQLGG